MPKKMPGILYQAFYSILLHKHFIFSLMTQP